MVEPKIGALHVWLRASILSFSCPTSLHCVMLCNRVWHADISLTNTVFSETGLLPWCSEQELGVFTVYCSWKGFLYWKPPSEENFCQLILMGRASGGTWRNLCSKTLGGRNPEPLAKAGAGRGSVERERMVPAERSWAVQSQCHRLALQNENVPAPCQKMSCGSTLTLPIFSCKGSYEFSSFFLCWIKALRWLCHKHEMVRVGEDWSQIIQGLNLCLSAW